jgi:hypothetical protein
MKQIITIITTLALASSCATARKSKMVGAITGGLLGSFIGAMVSKETSPNPESDSLNQIIGLSVGLSAGTWAGYQLGDSLHNENPENYKGKELKIENVSKRTYSQKPIQGDRKLDFSDLKIEFDDADTDAYLDTVSNEVPSHLKDKVKKQVILEHKIPQQKFQTEDGKTIIINETTAIEHIYTE